MKEETKGKLVNMLVPQNPLWRVKYLLLGTKLGKWYDKNPYHKFNEGDILILKNRLIFGYGIRPVAFVNGYSIREDEFGKRGKYDITMHRDMCEDWSIFEEERLGCFMWWMKRNEVPQGVERTVTEHEIHFKWNIENQFKRVSVNNIDEALARYKSIEVMQEERAA